MKISTLYFGELNIDETDIINFENGILGFEEYKKYVLLRFSDDNDAMFCLQGVEKDSPAFVVFNPFLVIDDYSPIPTTEDLSLIESETDENIDYYLIAVVGETTEETVVNMMSPIMINGYKKSGCQIVMSDSNYSLRFPLFTKEA